ncbi:regulator of Vps4 activity in the MVB pathway-domain-containing protein [Mycena alexandri]|uniref:Regulator of Vps4 activity in the MVB pathway-domain-containing protein n=1 Tax=Mycena alexandri TaxID=1745969 RepID=A0AAD6SCB2_9AGAR|nr:regulator of Vps4 activity in the MVB pathway-domain-containing protein [Mycena alexandri]
MPPWNAPKAKVQLRLSVQRLRILQQKKEAQAKASRRDIASLLERGKLETARVKVETIINEDIHVELLELLELYSELLLARFGLLDQNTREPDPGIAEGVCSIIHAAPRTELKELHVLRDILMHKYGREFSMAVMENRDGCVSDRVMRKLGNATPSADLVDGYLTEIAKAYGVEWSPPLPAYSATEDEGEGDDEGSDGGSRQQASAEGPNNEEKTTKADDPAGATLKLPAIPPTESELAGKEKKSSSSADDSGGGGNKPKVGGGLGKKGSSTSPPAEEPEDEFDVLAKRFAALKKR